MMDEMETLALCQYVLDTVVLEMRAWLLTLRFRVASKRFQWNAFLLNRMHGFAYAW